MSMTVPETIRDLVHRFERNRDAYRSPEYNETRLRREFVDPFFEALGWDVANRLGYLPVNGANSSEGETPNPLAIRPITSSRGDRTPRSTPLTNVQ
jgi:hypothetical protein